MNFKTLFAAALLFASSIAAANEADSAVDRLIDSAGLAALEGQEREAARLLVRRLVTRSSSSDTLTESAKEYMRNEGYKPVHLSTISLDGTYYLVARSRFSTYATKDIPFGVGTILFKEGEYFAKENIVSGGVSEFIDQNGNNQSLMFAEWISIR